MTVEMQKTEGARATARYHSRSPNARPTTITLDVEVRRLLKGMATGKTLGAFLSGLIGAEAARKEERQRVRQAPDDPTAPHASRTRAGELVINFGQKAGDLQELANRPEHLEGHDAPNDSCPS